ncbi:spindle assembly abnormal protein 6 homolog [Pieris rapae]|uniref:spindle assembly abnormal protein 6 homolog n=1 Tax=Pieris rapae TaxID=64459 RepID=UPI001E27E0B4|nr:spindle assembly abnormal protein 6 homolog [Pieris rapae]
MISKTFHKGKYYISFKLGFEESKRDISIAVDKIFNSDSLRLTLSNEDDPTFLCRIVITRCDYEELKKQQGLLIDFDNFPSQVVRLLQQCTANNMFLILHQINPDDYNFEVVEHNEFKRLVHLSLKTGPATDHDVKQHMSETISELKKTLISVKSSAAHNEALINDRCGKLEVKIHELTMALSKMEEDKLRRESEYQESLRQEKDRLAQEKLQLQKSADLNAKNVLASSQENLNKKDKQIDELHYSCRQMKETISQLERQISEKNQRTNYLEKEVQKFHLEVTTLSSKNTSLEREVNDREKQIHNLNIKCSSLEKTVKDNSDVIKELTENVQSLTLEKNSLERRLSLSESLASRNNEAAQSTSEQLLKANQIISKQNSDLIEMKDKLLCRTAIALEQEKVIERNSKEIEELTSQIKSFQETIEKQQTDVETWKEKCELNELTVRDRDETIKNNNMVIQWLHKKLEETNTQTTDRHKTNVASSTPYFINRNTSTMENSDESINFYATSKSNIEDSSNIIHSKERITKGLDPKYLKPSEDTKIKKKDSSKPTASQNKGKENKNIELPKVDYREKKSSKQTTYRATPVSAYFP